MEVQGIKEIIVADVHELDELISKDGVIAVINLNKEISDGNMQ